MPDRRCHACGSALTDSEGWIIPLDYPEMDPLFSTYDKVRSAIADCSHGAGAPQAKAEQSQRARERG